MISNNGNVELNLNNNFAFIEGYYFTANSSSINNNQSNI